MEDFTFHPGIFIIRTEALLGFESKERGRLKKVPETGRKPITRKSLVKEGTIFLGKQERKWFRRKRKQDFRNP